MVARVPEFGRGAPHRGNARARGVEQVKGGEALGRFPPEAGEEDIEIRAEALGRHEISPSAALSSSLVITAYMKSTTRSSLPDLTGALHMELFEQPEKSIYRIAVILSEAKNLLSSH